MASTPPDKKKVCSDLEFKPEVDAEERLKRKAARRIDKAAARGGRGAKEDGATKAKGGSGEAGSGKKRKRGRPKGSGKASGKRASIKRVREERRIRASESARRAEEEDARGRARKGVADLDEHPGKIVAAALGVQEGGEGDGPAAPEDFFWEVETVVGRRIKRGRVEYLIRWRGCGEDENTWEPAANLCDTAMEEASKYTKALKLKEKQREEDEKKLFGSAADVIADNDEKAKDVSEKDEEAVVIDDKDAEDDNKMVVDSDAVVDDDLWKWTDADQVTFREVERIDVNDPKSASIVTEARVNGTPVVLTGHVGWADFAKRWLTEKKAEEKNASIAQSKGEGVVAEAGVVSGANAKAQRDGDNRAGIATDESPDSAMEVETTSKAADEEQASAGEPDEAKCVGEGKEQCWLDLSHENYELDVKKMIEDIGGEDVPVIKRNYNEEDPIHGKIAAEKFLTTCWPIADSPSDPQEDAKSAKGQKKSSSRLYLHQWQFPLSDTAGRKLCHQCNPLPKGIMGEDLLKYWLDLDQCKYDSPLQYLFMGREDTLSKLHKDPGGLEISIAPIVGRKDCVLVHRAEGSNCLYHLQASLENLDLQRHPLLSQARIWRTTIEPGEILLMPYGTYHQCRNLTPCLSYSRFHLDTVNLLPFLQSMVDRDAREIDHEEVLWNLTSELINQVDKVFDAMQSRVKAGLDEGDLINDKVVETVSILRTLRHIVREIARREEVREHVKGPIESDNHDFSMLVDDVDMCLHEFRYRRSKEVPQFKARRGKALRNTLSKGSGGRKDVIKRDISKYAGVVAFSSSLENNYMSVNADVDKHFPNAAKDKIGESLIGELVPGDMISVRLEQKYVKAEVIEIVPTMKSVYLSFEDYPSVYDEYQPYELVRLPTGAEIPPEDIKPGLVVIDLSNRNEYRAKIQSIMNGPMAKVKLIVSQHEMVRFVSPAMILGRYVPKKRAKKVKNVSVTVTEIDAAAPPAPVMRPTEVGQIVEMGRRGAARVTKVHGEPKPTHVDLAFILGNAHSECMVPIEEVTLAPELDPSQGRGRRQVAKKVDGKEAKADDAAAPEIIQNLVGSALSPSVTDLSD
ncbi:hypothetical protein ACHAWF_018375 [Thalassiosira exigua]